MFRGARGGGRVLEEFRPPRWGTNGRRAASIFYGGRKRHDEAWDKGPPLLWYDPKPHYGRVGCPVAPPQSRKSYGGGAIVIQPRITNYNPQLLLAPAARRTRTPRCTREGMDSGL